MKAGARAFAQKGVGVFGLSTLSIRAGKPLNEAKAVAESTLTGIMGRESAYSGRSVEWDEILNAPSRLGPAKYEMGSLPFPEVAIPGQYRLS